MDEFAKIWFVGKQKILVTIDRAQSMQARLTHVADIAALLGTGYMLIETTLPTPRPELEHRDQDYVDVEQRLCTFIVISCVKTCNGRSSDMARTT